MNPRALLPVLLLLLVSSLPGAAARPNIVWIVTEDNSKHQLRLYDPAGAPMPAMRSRSKAFGSVMPSARLWRCMSTIAAERYSAVE